MPFKSEKQRRFLWANRPDIAERWEKMDRYYFVCTIIGQTDRFLQKLHEVWTPDLIEGDKHDVQFVYFARTKKDAEQIKKNIKRDYPDLMYSSIYKED